MAWGAHGKIPALGDFLRLGLPPAFVAPWDRWLQGAVAEAASALGERWTPLYMSAPAWRFALAPGLAGPGGALGVLMPSVDAVGRRFPLTLAAPVPAAWPTAALHAASRPLLAAVEDAALATLGEGRGAGPAALRDALARLPPPIDPGGSAAPAAGRARPGAVRPSLWDEAGGRRMAVEGLPRGRDALALFDPEAAPAAAP